MTGPTTAISVLIADDQAMVRAGRPIPEALAHLGEKGTARQEAAAVLERTGSTLVSR